MWRQRKKLAQVARLWASGQLETHHDPHSDQTSLDAMAAFGLVEDAPADPPATPTDVVWLWPCNVRTWGIWQRIQTQWRVGANGRDGLDYQGVSAYLREVERIKPRHFAATFAALQAMEWAALDEWAKQRKTES